MWRCGEDLASYVAKLLTVISEFMKWVMIVLLFASAVSTIQGIGKSRPPVTVEIATWVVIIDMVLIAGLVYTI